MTKVISNSFTMTEATFTKRVAKSGRGLLLWIPKDVADYLELAEDSTVEIKIKKLKKGEKNEQNPE